MAGLSKQWYAVYTAPRAEKKVSKRFTELDIEHYLPLQKVMRKWSDRMKEVEVPVMNGYIFVRIYKKDFDSILKVFGALAFVKEFYKPVAIPEKQIEMLKFMVEYSDEKVEFYQDDLEIGKPVKISKGPLQGLIGELLIKKGKHKVVIRIEKFGCALTTIPTSFITKL